MRDTAREGEEERKRGRVRHRERQQEKDSGGEREKEMERKRDSTREGGRQREYLNLDLVSFLSARFHTCSREMSQSCMFNWCT